MSAATSSASVVAPPVEEETEDAADMDRDRSKRNVFSAEDDEEDGGDNIGSSPPHSEALRWWCLNLSLWGSREAEAGGDW